jgi:hypothetical protein
MGTRISKDNISRHNISYATHNVIIKHVLVSKQNANKSELWISPATIFCAFVDNSLPAAVSSSLSRPALGSMLPFFKPAGHRAIFDLPITYDPLRDRPFAPMDNQCP